MSQQRQEQQENQMNTNYSSIVVFKLANVPFNLMGMLF